MTDRRTVPAGAHDPDAPGQATTRRTARRPARIAQLLTAAHLGPTVAVTAIAGLLAVAFDLPVQRGVLVTLAVLTGQLTIGWGNDLLDAARDRSVGRDDKPLATGELPPVLVRRALVGAAALCVVLSLSVGWRSGAVHLLVAVAAGHLYNLGLKVTVWSWLPYAVAFGMLPAVISLADTPPQWPPLWMSGAAAGLGVAAHLLNTLRDLEDDAATGVRGLPHRMGERRSRWAAAAILLLTTSVLVLGPAGTPALWSWLTLGVVVLLTALTLLGRGRVPFSAAVLIALCNVVLLVVVAT